MTERDPVLVLLVLASGVAVLMWGTPLLSGWARLSARYRLDEEVEGPRWRGVSVGFGPLMWYNRCLTVTAGRQGLRLRMRAVLRLSHASLLIPWDRIVAARPWGGALRRGVALDLGGEGGPVIFARQEYLRMQEHFPERLRVG